MGVENTQEENSLKEKSVAASTRSIKIIGLTEVRDENMKDEMTQSESEKSQTSARTPTAKGSATRFSSRFGRQPNCKTPSPSRRKEINGRPITWAPKKKTGVRSPLCSKNDSGSVQEERRLEAAKTLYTAEAIGNHLHDRLQEIKEKEERKAKIRANIERKRNEAAAAARKKQQEEEEEEEEKSLRETKSADDLSRPKSPEEPSPTNDKKKKD
uniref:Uncharacterized protein n=1 Tax=Panagrolaimus sp. ES5 TaxID=591445 RepID=A0AC34G2I4_9BILA